MGRRFLHEALEAAPRVFELERDNPDNPTCRVHGWRLLFASPCIRTPTSPALSWTPDVILSHLHKMPRNTANIAPQRPASPPTSPTSSPTSPPAPAPLHQQHPGLQVSQHLRHPANRPLGGGFGGQRTCLPSSKRGFRESGANTIMRKGFCGAEGG